MTGPALKRPTIHDVARTAEVAIGTVSRYLNGRPTREASARRIEEAIAHLGFVRNLAAATMRNETSPLIGFLVSSYDEFQMELLARLTTRLQATGRLVLPLTHDGSEETMRKALLFFAEHRVGAIVASGDFPAMTQMRRVIGPEAHVVLFNNDLPGLVADRVQIDDAGAMRTAVSHLIGLGHRRIGFIRGRPGHSSAAGRLAGYHEALSDAGIPLDDALIAGWDWLEQAGYIGAQELFSLDRPPTAVACSSHLNAMGVISYARECGMAIPDDLSLISFGDTRPMRLIEGGIDSIALPVERMAEIIETFCLQPPKNRAGRQMMVDCDFIRRQSSARPG